MVIIICEVPTDFSNFIFVLKFIFLYWYTLLYCCMHVFYCTEECSRTLQWICLFWSLCFCTKRLTFFFVLELLFVYLELEIYFCIGVYILYWNWHLCIGIHIVVRVYILLYWYFYTHNRWMCLWTKIQIAVI